jgi:hypothetical protein
MSPELALIEVALERSLRPYRKSGVPKNIIDKAAEVIGLRDWNSESANLEPSRAGCYDCMTVRRALVAALAKQRDL